MLQDKSSCTDRPTIPVVCRRRYVMMSCIFDYATALRIVGTVSKYDLYAWPVTVVVLGLMQIQKICRSSSELWLTGIMNHNHRLHYHHFHLLSLIQSHYSELKTWRFGKPFPS